MHVCVGEGARAEPGVIDAFWAAILGESPLHRSCFGGGVTRPESQHKRRLSRLAQRRTLLAPSLLFMLKDRGHRKTRLVASHVMRCAFRSRAEVIFLEGEYRAASLPMIPILM